MISFSEPHGTCRQTASASVHDFGASVTRTASFESRNRRRDCLRDRRTVDVSELSYLSWHLFSAMLQATPFDCRRYDWERDLGKDNVMSSIRPAVKSVLNKLFGVTPKDSSNRS